jgi:tetratricopeptide (TPR) repeat protein
MKAKLIFILILGCLIISPNLSLKAQDESKFGEDPETCKINISLYQEFFRQWKESKYKSDVVEDAIKPWRDVLTGCPKAQQSTYTNGVKIMTYLINKEKDQELKEKYIDTLLMLYDKRIEFFGREGQNLSRKGADYYKYRTQNFAEANAIFKRSIDLLGNNSQGAILNYFFRTTAKMVNEEVVEKAAIIDAYDLVSNIIDFNIKKFASDSRKLAAWKNTKGNIEAQFEPFATCDDLVSIYQIKFDNNKEDIELLNKIIDILDKKNCIESQLYFDATVQLYKMEPSPASAYLIGRMYLKEEDYNQALPYLKEATALEDEEQLSKIYFYMAMVNQKLNKLSEARKNARKAIENNANYGDAYILIGDLYGASASGCGDNDLTKRVGYWAAVDKYAKAKRVDPEVTDLANSRIREYSKHFPTTETIFFYNLKEGDSYKVECWINETTRIRAAK